MNTNKYRTIERIQEIKNLVHYFYDHYDLSERDYDDADNCLIGITEQLDILTGIFSKQQEKKHSATLF